MRALSGVISCVTGFFLLTSVANASYLEHAEARKFIDEISSKHKFNRAELKGIFRQIERQDAVIEAISKPAERVLEWKDYRRIFVTEKRIAAGVAFWREHAKLLQHVENKYEVPAEIIVAIVGVETFFGRYKGKHPALASLATLAFDYPPRSKFFRSELEQFLLLAKEEGLDPLEIKGSYAAAMGMPQFISSSYREYAVDFDGDGQRNLWSNIADVTGSVANYFKRHGWQPGEPVAERITVDTDTYKALLASKLKPDLSDDQLWDAGIKISRPSSGKKSLYQLMGADGEELWVGHKNFYVITRYNHSKLYALAVYQLSREIAARYVE